MNNTLHTPGPWQLTFGENDAAIHNDVTIASINDDALAWEANAHLISSAPDLLSALEILLSAVKFIECQSDEGRLFSIERLHMGHDKGIREAKEAIAKAKGAA